MPKASNTARSSKSQKPRSETFVWSIATTEHALQLANEDRNSIVLRGKQSSQGTMGETKKTVSERIASEVMPELYAKDPIGVGKKVWSKLDSLIKEYRVQAKRLTSTGSGIGDDSLSGKESGAEEMPQEHGPGLQQVQLSYYIKPDGPDDSTPDGAKNIWASATEKIKQDFRWFPKMHAILCTRPNSVPIAVTTGLGPTGPQMVFHQPPSESHLSPPWDLDEIESATDPGDHLTGTQAVTGMTSHHLRRFDSDASFYIFPPDELDPPPVAHTASTKTAPTIKKEPRAVATTLPDGLDGPGRAQPPRKEPEAKSEKKRRPRESKNAAEVQASGSGPSSHSTVPSSSKRKVDDPFFTFSSRAIMSAAISALGLGKEHFLQQEHEIKVKYGMVDAASTPPVLPAMDPAPTHLSGQASQVNHAQLGLGAMVLKHEPSPDFIDLTADSDPATPPRTVDSEPFDDFGISDDHFRFPNFAFNFPAPVHAPDSTRVTNALEFNLFVGGPADTNDA
ncbi:hypothetical protein FRC11_010369 [Ceratobasidium sp. 423]|nr:hypothetical protein FRC11_010369 [Ceratobasidium sp. 423]